MILLHAFSDPSAYRGGIVAIGNFDGVHRGHQSMIEVLVRRAKTEQAPAVVLTFDPHPITLLRPGHAPASLSTLPWKAQLLGECGVDCVIAYPTDEALMNLTPPQFFDRIVQDKLNARGLVEGPNFFFGRDRAGDISTLLSLCEVADVSLDVVPAVRFDDRMVSSSAVRSAITDGRIAAAVGLLGHPFRVRGMVVRGSGRGADIGFPTANLENVETLMPADGVYAGRAYDSGRSYPAAINVGSNPTFNDPTRKMEVHLVGFTGELYGQPLDVDFLARLRETLRFESVAELQLQVERDVEQARALAEETEPNGLAL